MKKLIFVVVSAWMFSSALWAQSTPAEIAKIYAQVTGTYHGTITTEEGQEYAVNMRLWVPFYNATSGTVAQPVYLPTLAGSFEIFTSVNYSIVETFASGSYAPATRAVTLARYLPNVANNLDVVLLKKKGDKFEGTYCPSAKCNKVSVTRVKPEAKGS